MTPLDPRIQHVVVLMLENRSFDHLLGMLSSELPGLEGVSIGQYPNRDGAGREYTVATGAAYKGQLTLLKDYGHELPDALLQMYNSPPNAQPTMDGFVKSYGDILGATHPGDIMRCFEPYQLPVLTGLARTYQICDHWFSSVPGATNPNRAFAHFGTSFSRADENVPAYFGKKDSIFQRLVAAGRSTHIYLHGFLGNSMTYSFLGDQPDQYYRGYGDFRRDCKRGALPDYAFIEPLFSDVGVTAANDQHPDNHVLAGESLIKDVYQCLRSNDEVWHTTAFLLVWDEHGGIFDHVTPPTVTPDPLADTQNPKFGFDRLGIRVPAIVVSPYVSAGVVDVGVFEHASIPATLQQQFIGGPTGYRRERNARAFLGPGTTGFDSARPPRDELPAFHVDPTSRASLSKPEQSIVDGFAELATRHGFPDLSAKAATVRTSKDAHDFVTEAGAAIRNAPPSRK